MARSFVLLNLLFEAHERDGYETRRQAEQIRSLPLLCRESENISIFRLSGELIDQLEQEISPIMKTVQSQGNNALSNRIKVGKV